MLDHFPDEVPAEHARAALFSHTYMQSGWNRILPTRAILIMSWLTDQPMTRDQLDDAMLTQEAIPDGMNDSAWEPPTEWTDEELAAQAADFGHPAETAEAANADEQQRRTAKIAELANYSDALGMAPVQTMDDLLSFMVAARLVVKTGNGDKTQYDLNPAAPLPDEVLPLTAERQANEDKIRWMQLHEPTAQKIIRQFRPHDDDRPTALTTSLQRLGRQLGVDVETARAGLSVLTFEGDFTISRDPETIPEHAVFEIRVDWERFAQQRFSLRAGDSTGSD
jgi:hypothetical protein